MNWETKADEATQFCLQTFWDAKAGRFHPATPAKPDALPWDFMWANGVAFSMLVGRGTKRPAPLPTLPR